ncbi:hypothetical protein M378DRAFT_17469 [Amanita muscaria Koide BX008]|uniref:Uncharacterized protein n=1 Tax=Amanita muscaria (strain Koide BX008) TaxID=946122 RepID=A0A0C2WIS6_AMAMK|nr:hypothetical protein M378DRAFT_17469 [Amanita muscaria Koide BX008]
MSIRHTIEAERYPVDQLKGRIVLAEGGEVMEGEASMEQRGCMESVIKNTQPLCGRRKDASKGGAQGQPLKILKRPSSVPPSSSVPESHAMTTTSKRHSPLLKDASPSSQSDSQNESPAPQLLSGHCRRAFSQFIFCPKSISGIAYGNRSVHTNDMRVAMLIRGKGNGTSFSYRFLIRAILEGLSSPSTTLYRGPDMTQRLNAASPNSPNTLTYAHSGRVV